MGDDWTVLEGTAKCIAAASYAAVAAVLFHSLRGRRRSTATTVLAWFGLLAVTTAATCLLDASLPGVVGLTAEVKLVGTLALAGASLAIAVVLVRLTPRAAAFQDYQNLQAAAQELRASKDRFQRAIDGSLSGLWEWNIYADMVWYSPRFREMLGYENEGEFPATLQSWKSAIHPDDAQYVFDALGAYLNDQSEFDVEYRLRTRSGEYRWFNARGLAICDPEGRPYLMSGSLQDITRRKQAEEAVRRQGEYLNQKQKMEALGELAGGAAHEFNNLLQAISGQIQFAQRGLPADSPANEELVLAADLVQQSAGFTRQLLDFSRRPASTADSVKPNEIVAKVATMLRSMLKGNIELNVHLGKEVAPVLTDPNTLQQALLNLCINARDAMPKGGKIVIRTRRGRFTTDVQQRHPEAKPGDYAVMSVTDTGCGMTAEARTRIFEPFFTTKAAGKGTGLGLAVAFTIVKEWGGFIDVISTPSKGSTFAIWLPANHQTPRAAAAKPKTPPPARREGQATILYAEDNEAA